MKQVAVESSVRSESGLVHDRTHQIWFLEQLKKYSERVESSLGSLPISGWYTRCCDGWELRLLINVLVGIAPAVSLGFKCGR